MSQNKKEQLINIIGWILLFVFFVLFHYQLWVNMDYLLNSDMSSELLLSKILSEEHTLISKNWYYSTELRVLNIQIIFSILFLFINNWHAVRIIGIIILNLILLLSFVFLCNKLKIKYIPSLCFFIVGAFCKDYLNFVLLGSYYVPYISVSFFSMGLLIDIINNIQNKKNLIKIILLLVISFLSGLGGLRQIVIFYFPLFVTASLIMFVKQYRLLTNKKIDKAQIEFKAMALSFIALVTSSVGWLISKTILSNLYSFDDVGVGIYVSLPTFEKFVKILKGWMNLFTLDTNSFNDLSINIVLYGIIPIILIVLSVLICKKVLLRYKEESYFDFSITLFYIVSSIIITCSLFISAITFTSRYLLINYIFIVVVLGVYIRNNNKKIVAYFLCLLCLLTVFNSFRWIKESRNEIRNNDLLNIKETLYLEESKEGYAPFWYANVLTELSDGDIEVWSYGSNTDKFNPYSISQWLQDKNHLINYPKGRVFLIINPNDSKENEALEKMFKDSLKYKGKEIDLFVFDNVEILLDLMK